MERPGSAARHLTRFEGIKLRQRKLHTMRFGIDSARGVRSSWALATAPHFTRDPLALERIGQQISVIGTVLNEQDSK